MNIILHQLQLPFMFHATRILERCSFEISQVEEMLRKRFYLSQYSIKRWA
jgi:hypothetical protein